MSEKISPRQRIHGMHETFVTDKLNELRVGEGVTRPKIVGTYTLIVVRVALALFMIVFAIFFAFYLAQFLLHA